MDGVRADTTLWVGASDTSPGAPLPPGPAAPAVPRPVPVPAAPARPGPAAVCAIGVPDFEPVTLPVPVVVPVPVPAIVPIGVGVSVPEALVGVAVQSGVGVSVGPVVLVGITWLATAVGSAGPEHAPSLFSAMHSWNVPCAPPSPES